MTESIRIGNGRVVLPRAVCERHFASASAAILLERAGQVFLVPLGGPSAGGMLLKQSNAHGDKVLLATDFLAERGLGPFAEDRDFAVRWVDEAGALLIEGMG